MRARVCLRARFLVGCTLAAGLLAACRHQPKQEQADVAKYSADLRMGEQVLRSQPEYPQPVPVILANLQSQDNAAEVWVITMYATTPGESEVRLGGFKGRDVGPEGFTASRASSEFPSGTRVRVEFALKDAAGEILFDESRSMTLP